MTLSKEEKNKHWTTVKTGWAKLKDPEFPESEKDAVEKAINDSQKALGLEVTKFVGRKVEGKVNWPDSILTKDLEELANDYDKYITLAVKIVKIRLPNEPTDGTLFGQIVNATIHNLILLNRG